VFTSKRLAEQSAVGLRRLRADAAVTPADRWHIGSITKSFTATLVAKLVERGDLKWTQTLGELLGAERARAYGAVTIEQVLSHRSGMPANLTPALSLQLWGPGDAVTTQRQRAADAILATPQASAPGERYLYSNAGYILIGAIIESRTGRAWEDVVQAEVLSPVGLHMTIADLARWGQEHLRGERGKDGVVRAAAFQYLHRPPADGDYALGWAATTIGGRKAVWHNGSHTLWYAAVAFDPAADRGVALATNGSIGAQAAIEGALAQLLGDKDK
jgi:CubicO group peptidase (beta-lactamase class C family)